MSALEWVSTIMSSSASLRTTSRSAIISISRTTPIGYASTACRQIHKSVPPHLSRTSPRLM